MDMARDKQLMMFDDVKECPECGYSYARIYDMIKGKDDERIIVECLHCGHKWERI